jgi:hypothetical protein
MRDMDIVKMKDVSVHLQPSRKVSPGFWQVLFEAREVICAVKEAAMNP